MREGDVCVEKGGSAGLPRHFVARNDRGMAVRMREGDACDDGWTVPLAAPL